MKSLLKKILIRLFMPVFREAMQEHSYKLNILTKAQQDALVLMGKVCWENLETKTVTNLQDAEFKVFSQWGDDGIIQYLLNVIDLPVECFIEFGVENYLESNTRFLLMNNNWSGLVMDASKTYINYIKRDGIYWQYDLSAVQAFVTTENINQLISDAGYSGDVGLLSIDIDGNDYWVWKAINCISPIIVVVEYNSAFGSLRSITTPYDPLFYRMQAHHSGIYAGASLAALCDLATEKGYSFVGSNSAGNNAYFVRDDFLGSLQKLGASEGYVASKFRQARNRAGELIHISDHEAVKDLEGLKVMNTRTGKMEVL